MGSRRLRPVLFTAFLLVLLSAASILLLNALIHHRSVQDYLLRQLSNRVGVEVDADDIQVIFWKGLVIEGSNLRVGVPGKAQTLGASRVSVHLSLPDLIRGRIVPTGLVLEEPDLELDPRVFPEASLREDQSEHLATSPLGPLAVFPSVTLERARIRLKGVPAEGTGLSLRLSRSPQDSPQFHGSLSGKVVYQGKAFPLSAEGDMAWKAPTGWSARLKVKAEGIPLSPIQLPDLPVKGGTAHLKADVMAGEKGISAKGSLHFRDLDFAILDKGDRKDFFFESVHLPFDASYANDEIEIPAFQVKGPGFTLNAAARLSLKDRANPYLDMSLKGDVMALGTFHGIFPSSLLPSWVESRLFPIFSGGSVRVDHFSLRGGLREIGDLHLARNAGALRLKLTCSDLTAFKDEEGIPVEGVSGVMTIENGTLSASGIRCHFRGSEIEGGALRVSSLYDEDPAIHITAGGSVRIEDLIPQKDLSLIPDEVRRHTEVFSSATGEIKGKIEVGYERGWPSPRLLRGELRFEECSLHNSGLVLPLYVKEGELIVNGEETRRFSVKGRWGRSWVDATGRLESSWETGEARLAADLDLAELIGHFRPELHSHIFPRRPVPCRLTLAKGDNRWRFQGGLDLKDISLETGLMTLDPFGVKGNLDFDGEVEPGKGVSISHLGCTAGESALQAAGAWEMGGQGRFDLTVFSKGFRLQDLGVRLKRGNLVGEGTIALEAGVRGYRSRPGQIVVTGEARGRDLSFTGEALPHPVEQGRFDLQFNETTVSVDALDLKLGASRFHLTGKLQGWEGLKGDLTIHSADLDLSDLISPQILGLFHELHGPSRAAGPPSHLFFDRRGEEIPRFIAHSDIHLEMRAERGRWEGIICGPLSMECAIRSGDLYVARATALWEHGKISGRGHVKRGPQPDILFSAYLEMTRQPLNALPPSLDFIRSRAEGMLTMQALLFARGADRRTLLSNLSGSADILLEEGVFKKTNLIIKLLDFLSIEGKLEGRPAHLPEGGLYFERVGGQIDLDQGIARTEDLTMHSPVFNAALKGEANLNRGRIDAEVGVHPFGSLDSLLNKVPVAGYLLTGDQKALYIEYFKVDGPLSDLEVRHIPLKSIGKGTSRLLSRLLLLPTRIFKGISEAAREFEGKGYPLPGDVGGPENDMGGLGRRDD